MSDRDSAKTEPWFAASDMARSWFDVARMTFPMVDPVDEALNAIKARNSIRNLGQCLAVAGALQAMFDAGWDRGADVEAVGPRKSTEWRPNAEGKPMPGYEVKR